MKRTLVSSLVLFVILLGGCEPEPSCIVNAEVLSINEQITEGQLIGSFLGSPDGSFTTDSIKVGVKFTLGGKLFLRDLSLNHAELSYYQDSKVLLIELKMYCTTLKVYLHGRPVGDIRCTIALSKQLRKDIKDTNSSRDGR
jgi:hypothetical protein